MQRPLLSLEQRRLPTSKSKPVLPASLHPSDKDPTTLDPGKASSPHVPRFTTKCSAIKFLLSNPGRVPTSLSPLDEGTAEPDAASLLFSHFLDDFNLSQSVAAELNAVKVQIPDVIQNFSILPDKKDCCNAANNSSSKAESPSLDHDDNNAIRAQIDTGAFASCTDQLHMLHAYRPFTKTFPCPIRLLPATEGSDLSPQGVGYLHVPALNSRGHIAVRTFYSPSLRTTVIDERDFMAFNGASRKDFTGYKIDTNHDSETFAFKASHRLCRSRDVWVHGIVRHGKLYTGPLISPDLPVDHPLATPSTSSTKAIKSDPTFARACARATIQAIHVHQEKEYASLREEMTNLPVMYHHFPFHEYIQRNTPIHTIQSETERLLWHQRLGHPSDYYLFNAHKHVKGVPTFNHGHPVLDKCPTCAQAKQTKEAAGENSTRTATVPFQGLSVDFSFSG